MDLEIKELTSEQKEDYFDFFDNHAFSDNPDWSGCYCYFYHCTDKAWEKRTAQQNKQDVGDLISSGCMRGFLAYMDGKPVGWCHADDKKNLARLQEEGEKETGAKSGAIVCFIIAPEYRRKGIATALLKRVCEDFKAKGYVYLEAYPRLKGKTDAENYHGPLDMYLGNGFVKVSEEKDFAAVKIEL